MRALILAALAACGATGCSASRRAAAPTIVTQGAVAPESADHQLVWSDHAQVLEIDAQIEELSSRGDCGSACQAGAQLCTLSDRICEISGRHPGDGDIGGRCEDGRSRCERARERLATACECPTTAPIE